jgi:hypothetical protein
MLSRTTRYLAPLLLGAFALPLLLMPTAAHRTVSEVENRALARAPALPRDHAGWRTLPRKIDAYFADHFAHRDILVRADLRVQKQFGGRPGPAKAVEGKGGWMFLSDGLLESTGQLLNPAQSDDYAAYICDIDGRLRRQGAKVLFTLMPSTGAIYPEYTPDFAGPPRRVTNYDRILSRVRACGVKAIDLRPDLRRAKAQGLVYKRTDSHWTERGSLVAYNAIVTAFGRPDWRYDVAPQTWDSRVISSGGLPALAGLPPRTERVPIHALFNRNETLTRLPIAGLAYTRRAPYLVETDPAGPGLLVVGDSFTVDDMPPLFADRVGRFVWVHQDGCAFDWNAVTTFKPDYVLIAPVEREARCHGRRPLHLPRESPRALTTG